MQCEQSQSEEKKQKGKIHGKKSSQVSPMKKPKLLLKDVKTINPRKSVGRPPDSTRSESNVSNSFDPSFLVSLEKIRSVGMEQYPSCMNLSNVPLKDIVKRLEHLNFFPGVLKDNIYIFKQISQISQLQLCTMSVDVFPIEPLIQFDKVSEVFTGFVAPLSSEMKLASEAVVFMLQGFEVEWKCVAGYMLVNYEEDGWAIWHVLNQIILLLAQYDFTVINVVLGEGCGFEILDNHADENIIRGNSTVQHPYYQSVILCFSKGIDELILSVSQSILHSSFILPEEILTKFELSKNFLKSEHLKILIGNETLSADNVVSWLFQRDRVFPEDDKMPNLKTEIFILRMLWMWVNAITFVIEDDASGFYSMKTHLQTLRDTFCIFEVLEKSPDLKKDELLWSNMRRTTSSAFSLYDNYVGKGLVSCLRCHTFRCTSLNHLKSLIDCNDLSSQTPKPCSVLQFLRMVSAAVILHPNFAAKDFESGLFFEEFLKYRRTLLPVDIEESEDLSDINGLGLYYLSSRVITKLISDNNDCDKCRGALLADNVNQNIPSVWTEAVEKMSFFHPSVSVYDTLQWAESHFVNIDEDILRLKRPCTQFAYRIYGEMAFSIRSTFPSCHDTLRNLLSLFIILRLKMVADDLTKRLK